MQQITLREFLQLCPYTKPNQLLILMYLSEFGYPEVWVSQEAIAQGLNISVKTVQRATKKLEKLSFLSVKRSPKTADPKARDVNKYSLNYETIRKTILKQVFKFDSWLTQLLDQVQSGTANQKFLDFLGRHNLRDSNGIIDLPGLASIGTTLAEITQAMNSDSKTIDTQTQLDPEELLDLPDPLDEYSGEASDKKHLCPDVKKLFLRVLSGEITHPAAVKFFKQSYFKGLWDDPDSGEAAKATAQDLGEMLINGMDDVVWSINSHFALPEDGKFSPDS